MDTIRQTASKSKQARRSGDPYVYRYRVTASTVSTVPVGTILIDRRRELVHDWHFMNLDTGAETYFVGERFGERLCPSCYRGHRKASAYGHAGSHEDAPKLPTVVE